MACKNFLKIYLEKDFFSFAGRRLTSGPRSKLAQPASRARLASLGPAQRRAARPTAAELARRVAAMRRRRRRVSQPACARLHLPKPVRSLAHSRVASPLRQSRAPAALPLATPRTRRRNPPRLLHLGQQSRTRSSALLSFKSCSRLRRLPSSGRAVSSPTTVGHGAAVLGRHGRHLPPLLQPRLATLPPSPSSREPRAPANSPCPGWQWPPASWPSRAAATSQRRRGLCLSQARPSQAVGRRPAGPSPPSLRSGRAGQMWPWAS